jgi:hypothetical protein
MLQHRKESILVSIYTKDDKMAARLLFYQTSFRKAAEMTLILTITWLK